jgi:hypothetical protein
VRIAHPGRRQVVLHLRPAARAVDHQLPVTGRDRAAHPDV